jgi:hypothetical protein
VIHKLITSIWNKEEMPDQCKESIIVPIHKRGHKTDCNNYRGISLLLTSYKILSNILLSQLSPYIDVIIILTKAEWTLFQTHCYSENLVALVIEPGTSQLAARNSDH